MGVGGSEQSLGSLGAMLTRHPQSHAQETPEAICHVTLIGAATLNSIIFIIFFNI